jgi:hypothetical protein
MLGVINCGELSATLSRVVAVIAASGASPHQHCDRIGVIFARDERERRTKREHGNWPGLPVMDAGRLFVCSRYGREMVPTMLTKALAIVFAFADTNHSTAAAAAQPSDINSHRYFIPRSSAGRHSRSNFRRPNTYIKAANLSR